MIAIVFSLMTIAGGFSQIVYIPIETTKMIDLTVVGFIFAVLIGGYSVGIPLSIVWSLITWFNIPLEFREWELWQVILTRVVFAVALVFSYDLARKIHPRSPLNVYRAVIAGILVKCLVALPFDIITRGISVGLKVRVEIAVLEIALGCVFMGLLVKHLRQIHILNGVKKREKGDKQNGIKDSASRQESCQ